ncbi:MAG TPA: TauD/TfdA family dioxygenase, partial [Gammaproteobacteria bacterium]|nr:TauD/TfdA family dioxygenase [Gammaproteobacteria bacterium]
MTFNKETSNITPFQSDSAWTAREMADPATWVYRVTESDVAEIDAALRFTQARGLGIPDITRETFPLDGLKASLADILRQVEDGRGFAVLRGLPIERYSREEAQIIFWGLGAYWGEAVGQNQMGDVVGHVMDINRDWNTDNHGRGYQSKDALSFHCDKNDAVALMCWNPSKSGGKSCIASSAAIHNAMLDRRPDLLELLYGPFHVDFRGEEMAGHKPYNVQPVVTRQDDL